MTPQKTLSVLVVDDEAGFRNLLKWELTSQGMEVETAENGVQAVAMAVARAFDVIISDVSMPEMDGLKLLNEIKRCSPQTAVIIATGFGAVETAVFAMQEGAFDFILKPYDLQHLLSCVRRALDRRSHCRSCGRSNRD